MWWLWFMTWCELMSKHLLKVATSRSDGGVRLMRGHWKKKQKTKKLVVLFLCRQSKNVAVSPPEAFFLDDNDNFLVYALHEQPGWGDEQEKNTEEEVSGNSLCFYSGGGAFWTAGLQCWFRSQDLFEQHAVPVWCWGTQHNEWMMGSFAVCHKAGKGLIWSA